MNAVAIYIMLDMMDVLVIYYLITHIICALYLRAQGANKWLLALVPFGQVMLFHTEVTYIPKWLRIQYIVVAVAAILMPVPMVVLFRCTVYAKDYFIAPAVCEKPAPMYMFIPCYRYYIMVKAILAKKKEGVKA